MNKQFRLDKNKYGKPPDFVKIIRLIDGRLRKDKYILL